MRLLRDCSSQPVEESLQPSTTDQNKQKKSPKSDPAAYIETHFLPNATVRVRYPDISEEERTRRAKAALQAVAQAEFALERELKEREEREAQEKQQE